VATSVVVTDKAGNQATVLSSRVKIDKTPPVMRSCVATPSVLSPPSHKLERVTVAVDAADPLSPVVKLALVSATSNETDPGSISGFEVGSKSLSGFLRSERNSNGSGRLYSLRYAATDAAGNSSTCTVNVLVPNDPG
jgi:hypothetical protein